MSGRGTSFQLFLTIGIALSFLSGASGEQKLPAYRGRPSQVVIKGRTFTVEIADTPASQEQGLSDRASMPEAHGMLFIFPDKQVRTFWMRRMHFPLDILWIADHTVVGLDRNLPPEGDRPLNYYSSGKAVNYVLELNAGTADKLGIKTGDKVLFQ